MLDPNPRRALPLAGVLVAGVLAGPAPAQLTPNEQAVAHMLRRATFGPRPGQTATLAQSFPTDAITWLNTQLAGTATELPGYTTYLTSNWSVPLDASGAPDYGAWTISDLAAQQVARCITSENQLSTSRYLFRVDFAQSMHRRFNLPDPTGTVGYTSGINWHYLRFLLHDLLIYDPITNYILMIAYLQVYPAITPYLDLGDPQQIVDRVAEGVLQGDVDPLLNTQLLNFLTGIPAINLTGTLQTLIQQSNPQTNPSGWLAAFTEHGLRVNLFMSYAASLPQATLD